MSGAQQGPQGCVCVCASPGEDRRVTWEHLRKHGSDRWVKGIGLLPGCVSSVSTGDSRPLGCVWDGCGGLGRSRRRSPAQKAS